MIIPVNLRTDESATIRRLRSAADDMIIIKRQRSVTVDDLARLKKACENFLAIPIVQAIHTEGIK